MPCAVTNRYFPMLAHTLRDLFDIRLEHDPSLNRLSRRPVRQIIAGSVCRDPQGRIRLIYKENVDDLSSGRFHDRDVIGFNMAWSRLIIVAVPPAVEPISDRCAYVPRDLDSYLLAVTLHELYENLTGDVRHCHNPGRCLNSVCRADCNGTCCVCMAGLIEKRWPDLTLEDLYCKEHLAGLRRALRLPAPAPAFPGRRPGSP
ncbi:MAG: hypothetical protein A4E28_02389 [Methanocella sp. PtaU1.Bin125]|nr:MAG: hypothetical protein A4E28_02389 [Methanocella sp. PtaU1.Bin125]